MQAYELYERMKERITELKVDHLSTYSLRLQNYRMRRLRATVPVVIPCSQIQALK
jgi:hypothetical protein